MDLLFLYIKKNNRYAKSNDTLSPHLGKVNEMEWKGMK